MQVEVQNKEPIGSRLKGFIQHMGLNHSEFGSQCGIPKNSLSRVINGHVSPGSVFWQSIHEAFPDADIHYLVTGEYRDAGFGESLNLVKEERATYGKTLQRVYVAQAGDMIDANGYDGFVELEVSENYPTDEEFGKQLFLIEGESMVPTLEPGWLAWAQRITEESEFENGAVYMVLSGGRLQCKRVYLDPENEDAYTLSSDNQVIRDMHVQKRGAKLWRVLQYVGNRNLGGS